MLVYIRCPLGKLLASPPLKYWSREGKETKVKVESIILD